MKTMMHLLSTLLILKTYQVFAMSDTIKDLLTPLKSMGEACGYASCTEPQKDMLNIHVVPHTHGELGQTQTFYGYYTGDDDVFEHTTSNMKRILDYTISELWASKIRRFTISDMPYFFYWWSHRDETVRRMVYELLRQGRLNFVGGGWSMSDESTTSYHAIIDHFTYSLKKINSSFLDCGRPLVAWQVDAVGHSREFASLMAQMGYDGVFVSPIGYDDEISRIQRKEMEFLWRGSNDLGAETDIFAHVPFDGMLPPPGFCFSSFCNDPLLITSSDTFENILERVDEFLESVKHRQAPYYSTKNIMVLMGGRMMYSDASMWFENIDKLVQALNMQSVKTRIYAFYSTPACYLKAVYDESPTLRTKQDDFYPQAIDKSSYAVGAYTSRPSLKLLARESHRFLQMTKQLQVTARLGENGQFFEDFNWINGVFQDHHIITGELRPHVKDFYVKRMDTMLQQSMLVLQDAFNKLRRSPETTQYFKCQFNISRCINTCGSQPFIVVYNPLAWPVSMLIRLPIRDREYILYSPQLKRVEVATMPIPRLVQSLPGRNSTLDTELVFVAQDIPPMGYRSYYYRRRVLGWERSKRSLIKKINQNKPKKYLVRQNNASPDEEAFLAETDYEDSTTTDSPEIGTKIVFGNVGRNENESVYSVLTPKSIAEWTVMTESSTSESRIEVSTMEYNMEENSNVTTTADNISTTDPTTSQLPTISQEATTSQWPPVAQRPTVAQAPTVAQRPTVAPTTARTVVSATRTTTHPPEELEEMSESEEDRHDTDYWKGYEYMKSSKPFIRNKYVRVNLDDSRRIKNIAIANGIRMRFDIQMFYYVSDDPVLRKKDMPSPGAYVFRSIDNKQERILHSVDTTVYKSKLVQEIHCVLSPYAAFALRLYLHSPVLEVDWVVGPIPVEDGMGKDVFVKYVTDLENEGVFYTDSNGRQTLKRIRNRRPTYDPINKDPVAGNIYPVTSRIYIEDPRKNIRFSVLNDRSQGGSSLADGEIDLMLHRRLLTEDPINENMNETEFDQGVVVRGQHYIYLSKSDYKPTKIFEKKLAKEIELRPQVFVSSINSYGLNTKNVWKTHRNEYSALKSKLPVGIHILTVEQWNPKTLLLRLENYLEKQDVVLSGVKSVHLNKIFKHLQFFSVKEMTLAANLQLQEWTPLDWKRRPFFKNFNEAYGNSTGRLSEDSIRGLEDVDLDKPVILSPQQIRTFLLPYKFVP